MIFASIGIYRENAIAIESEAKDPFGGNVYYVTIIILIMLLFHTVVHQKTCIHSMQLNKKKNWCEK